MVTADGAKSVKQASNDSQMNELHISLKTVYSTLNPSRCIAHCTALNRSICTSINIFPLAQQIATNTRCAHNHRPTAVFSLLEDSLTKDAKYAFPLVGDCSVNYGGGQVPK